LGILKDYQYEVSIGEFRSGSTILLYTVGLSEAFVGDHFFGEGGAEQLLQEIVRQGKSVKSIESVFSNRPEIVVSDDITLLSVSKR
ncbi:MAG: SpoIIE family protein phosphatase, partial [bacterium]